jgi:RimJ/RimL family protein N-acetyltransferase
VDYKISSGYIPGAVGRVTELHASYYHENWGFGLYFETKVAEELAQFLQSFNPARDGFWVALVDKQIIGSISIVGEETSPRCARLRWLILDQKYQGRGLGTRLMREAMDFCRKAGFRRVYLTTFAGLNAARRLYELAGFLLIDEQEGAHWGKTVSEQTFELIM